MNNHFLFSIMAVALILLSLVCVSHAAGSKVIVIVKSKELLPYNQAVEAFEGKIRHKAEIVGYVLDEYEEKESLVKEINAHPPDLIFTAGTFALKFVSSRFSKLPIVFSVVLNPVGHKLIDGWDGSGNNLAGVALDIPLEMQFEWIKKVLPKVKRVGVLYHTQGSEALIKEAIPVASKRGIKVIAQKINGTKDILPALEALSDKIDLLWGIPDLGVFNSKTIKPILLFTLRNKMRFVGVSEQYVKAGALFCLSVDYKEQGGQAADIATTILEGNAPCGIPVSFPNNLRLAVNLGVADRIGVRIPEKITKNAAKY